MNDSDTPVVGCPFYRTWKAMLRRCYVGDNRSDAYSNCTASKEWLIFSNFKTWMEKQDWQGKQLDKDVLSDGNKIYSPETCVFVSQEFNKFLCTLRPNNKGLPIGVIMIGDKFTAEVSVCGKKRKLGRYETEEEAHLAWKSAKLEIARNFSEFSNNKIRESLFRKFSIDKALEDEDNDGSQTKEEKEIEQAPQSGGKKLTQGTST